MNYMVPEERKIRNVQKSVAKIRNVKAVEIHKIER